MMAWIGSADPIVSVFATTSTPAVCGSVCVPAQSASDGGTLSGNVITALASLDAVEFAEARVDAATGAVGAAVASDIGFSHAEGSHFDTWNCTGAACGALEVAGSFVPVTLHLHVSGSASLTPGAMDLEYSYDTTSLLGSNALGRFTFTFGEDPGTPGPDQTLGGSASFFDYHTGIQHDIPVIIAANPIANTGIIDFSADLTVVSYVGGCTVANCDLSQGIFTDLQALSAQLDPGNDGSAQILSSLNTFQTGFESDLPFVSADGRTATTSAVAPEPGVGILVGTTLLGAGLLRKRLSR
jgi:hypothetical protein